MPGRPYPRNGAVLSRDQLDRWSRRGPLREFLDYYCLRDVVLGPTQHGPDDFRGDTIDLNLYAVANGGGASAASYAINTQNNGVIRATTGTANDATASASIVTPEQYYGDLNCMCELRHAGITAVTDVRIETGFSDDIPDSNAAHVNSLTTPTVNATVVDAVLDVFNHSSSTVTNTFITIGTSIDAIDTAFTAPVTLVAATFILTRIMVFGNYAVLWRDGRLVAENGKGTDAVEGGSAMAWTAYIGALSATSKSHDIDYLLTAQNRA